MWAWLKRHGLTAKAEAVAEPIAPKQDGSEMAGKYRGLYKYLAHRYSNAVVSLTFGQIEDLLGFPLPDLARIDREWWTAAPSTTEPQHSQAWTQAGMTANPNLLAQHVVFERARRQQPRTAEL